MGMRIGSGFAGVIVISIAALFFAACGGGRSNVTGYVVPDNYDRYSPYDTYDYYDDSYYYGGNSRYNVNTGYYYGDDDYYRNNGFDYDHYGYYDEYGYYDSYGNLLYNPNDPAYLNIVERNTRYNDPFMRNYANISDRSVSQYVNSTYSTMLSDIGDGMLDLLVEVDGGSFYINPGEYTLATRNAVLSEGGNLESSLILSSSYQGVSLASYTLEEFSGYEQLATFTVEGSGSFSSDPKSGLYVGVRQFGDRDTRWYGPYRNGMDWEINPLKWNDRYVSKHCFVTLAVFGGDSVTINRLHAEVDY